jgi:hypothetical protein
MDPRWIEGLQATGISGSREFRNPRLVADFVRQHKGNLIVGDAENVDTIVASIAEAELPDTVTVVVVPFRRQAGRGGGLLRNPDVVRWARQVVCFWSGEVNHSHPERSPLTIGSTGTSHAGFWALLYGKPLTIYSADGSYVTMRPERGKVAISGDTEKGAPRPEAPSLRPPDPPSPDGTRAHLRPSALPFV